MGKTLYLEKRGCDFWEDDKIRSISDVGNYRVGSYDYSIKGKDGNDYILELGQYTKYNYRTTHKVTGKPLKKAIREVVMMYAICIDTQYENERGCWRNCGLEKELHAEPMLYTLENILAIVNKISVDTYTSIEFVNR